MAKNNGEYPGLGMRADPADNSIAGRIVGFKNRCDLVGPQGVLVFFVANRKALDASKHRMVLDRLDRVLLKIPYARSNHLVWRAGRIVRKRFISRAALVQTLKDLRHASIPDKRDPTYNVSIPERPALVICKRVVEDDDALTRFDVPHNILLALLRHVIDLIVENDDVGLATTTAAASGDGSAT